jgi:hypothetical protein
MMLAERGWKVSPCDDHENSYWAIDPSEDGSIRAHTYDQDQRNVS